MVSRHKGGNAETSLNLVRLHVIHGCTLLVNGQLGLAVINKLDELIVEAATLIVQTQQGSTSSIQRKMSIGYNRAGRIMDQMEQAGFIGPADGAKPRQVLITQEEFDAIFLDK